MPEVVKKPLNILVVSQWYAPEPIAPVPELAEGLAGLGHNVTVLTGFPNWPSGKLYPGYRLRLWQREVINGIPVIRVPLYPNHGRSAVMRSWNFISFALAALFMGIFLAKRPDVVYGVHPPITACAAAAILAKLWRRPFLMEVMDLWPETLRTTGMIRNETVLSLLGSLCKWTYARASAIRVVTEGFRDNLITKKVEPAKLNVISNWVNLKIYRPADPDQSLSAKLGPWDGFTVMYAGAIGLAQGLDVIVGAAETLRDHPKIRFVVVGDGVDRERLMLRCHENGIKSVFFVGSFSKERMPSILAMADVLLVHLRPEPLFCITIPHKIYAYMAAGKPIIGAVPGEAARVIHASGAGVVCVPGDPEALAAAIQELQGIPKHILDEMGCKGRAAARTQFSNDILIPQVADMIECIAAS